MSVPVNVFAPSNPHKGQLEVMNDQSRFKLLRAGRKWRKTSLGVSWLNELAALCTRKLTYPFILPFQTQARDSVWKDHALRLIDEFQKKNYPVKIHDGEMSITHPNGGRFKLLGSDNSIALRSVSNWGAVVLDEHDDMKSDLWTDVIRPNLMTHQAPALVMGTPKGKRNMWKMSQKQEFKEFHYTSYDNPDLPRDELEAMVREYQDRGEDSFRQEIMAEYVKPVGVVYREWNEELQFIDFEYEPNLPLHITFDWGVNDPTVVIWIQPDSSTGQIRILDYYETTDANIAHFVSLINSKPYKPADLYCGDPAGKARNLVTGTSVIEELYSKGINVRTVDGVRIPDQIRSAHSTMRHLYVNKSRAERFRDVLLNYRYPELNTSVRNQSNEMPIHDEWSHGARAYEYWCVNTQAIRPPSPLSITPVYGSGDYYIEQLMSRNEDYGADY